MRSFRLPDLGEGLDEAELVSWHVGPGDRVVADQPLVSVETAKAVVEIPSPWSGRIARLFGKPGDLIKVGAVVVDFDDGEETRADAGTVVGSLEPSTTPAPAPRAPRSGPMAPARAAPAVRVLAREHNVDLSRITGTGPGGAITRADVEAARGTSAASPPSADGDGYEPLRSVRRTMAVNMARSALEVPGSTVSDEVVVGDWTSREDVTLRLVEAMVAACRVEGALNAWYDPDRRARKLHTRVDLGIALDTPDGLFVPVLRDAAQLDRGAIRAAIDALKGSVAARKATAADLAGQTITLSNFGMMGGLTASLAIVPPQVAILGAGRIHDAVRPIAGKPSIVRVLPLSLTFDHRVVTGSEAVRFLNAVITDLRARKKGD